MIDQIPPAGQLVGIQQYNTSEKEDGGGAWRGTQKKSTKYPSINEGGGNGRKEKDGNDQLETMMEEGKNSAERARVLSRMTFRATNDAGLERCPEAAPGVELQ